jgi:hypothetical protein
VISQRRFEQHERHFVHSEDPEERVGAK